MDEIDRRHWVGNGAVPHGQPASDLLNGYGYRGVLQGFLVSYCTTTSTRNVIFNFLQTKFDHSFY
jgi:hypothetical protein